jgi:HEAT repeat protein
VWETEFICQMTHFLTVDQLLCDVEKERLAMKNAAVHKQAQVEESGRRCNRDLDEFIAMTYDPDPRVRKEAVHALCPCNLKANYEQVWDRLLAMVTDEDPKVRAQVFHTLADGSPRERERAVVQAIEQLQHDPDEKLRRRARKLLAHYSHGGSINIL